MGQLRTNHQFRKIQLDPGQYKFEEIQPLEKFLPPKELSDNEKVAVGSIFFNDEPIQRKWLDLQLSYLKATTKNFDHYTFIFKKKSNYFDQRSNVIQHTGGVKRNSGAHVEGLENLLLFFKSQTSEYKWFLFLDSDAFPIRINWLDLMKSRMEGSKKEGSYEVAVPIRFENLENRLHASVLLAKASALQNLDFNCRNIGFDLLQGSENDVTIGPYQDTLRRKAFVLLRSNKFSLNPLLCGIYYDMFYHHCCGSGRNYNMRGRDYWNHVAPPQIDVAKFTDELMKDPDAFIGKLAGWKPDCYARRKNEHSNV